MKTSSLSITLEPDDKPHVHFGDPTLAKHKHITVYLSSSLQAHLVAWDPESLFALADVLLSAGQQLEAAITDRDREQKDVDLPPDYEPPSPTRPGQHYDGGKLVNDSAVA